MEIAGLRAGSLDFSSVTAKFESRGVGRFAYAGAGAGQPLSFTLAGEGGLTPGAADLRVARLTGNIHGERFALEQPVQLQRRRSDFTLSQLALRFGRGKITAAGALRGEALAGNLAVSQFDVADAAHLLGRPNMRGELSASANLDGSLRAPHARFTVDVANFSLGHQLQTPRLGLGVAGEWNGRNVALRGEVTGLKGDRMTLTGSAPLLLTPSPLRISVPATGGLALNLAGGGEIGRLADLLPLGEDRLTGRFEVNASIGGTVAMPSASGRLRLAAARYENFASGAVLTNLNANLAGNGDRFQLVSLSAGDGAGGSVTAQGGLALVGNTGPSAQLAARLTHFRIAARDEVVATASGTITVSGSLVDPKITAPLTVDRAEINLPASLPANVVVLKVREINGKRQPQATVPAETAGPALAAQLDLTLGLAGPVLVQGHGLDSQWQGRLRITGTSAAPKIAGTLTAIRGSYSLLGKSFRLTHGTITFDGTAKVDPALDIVAEVNAADITAQVMVTGLASAPKVSLTSTPLLPQDEILARVLFGSNVRQMTAGQGLVLAQAAAAMSGHDLGVLDRLRGGLGLDWLRFGQGPSNAASSILNPSVVTPTTQSTAALSAGKYIAPGVSVGVTQGVSPPTSKVTVQVDLGRHVTVDTEAGQNGGTGIGLNYNYDY